MRFRPAGGIGAPKDLSAAEARGQVMEERPASAEVFDVDRHEKEILRAENVAAGLPP